MLDHIFYAFYFPQPMINLNDHYNILIAKLEFSVRKTHNIAQIYIAHCNNQAKSVNLRATNSVKGKIILATFLHSPTCAQENYNKLFETGFNRPQK